MVCLEQLHQMLSTKNNWKAGGIMEKLAETLVDLDKNDWRISEEYIEDDNGQLLAMKLLARIDGRFYHVSLVKIYNPDRTSYWAPKIFEEGDEKIGKVGDVICVLRQHPETKTWHVDIQRETVHISEKKTIETIRLVRSSIDNIKKQALRLKGRRAKAKFIGSSFSNAQRIGGLPIFMYFIITDWSQELYDNGSLISLSEYMKNSGDLIGRGCVGTMLTHADFPLKIAQQILAQVRAA